MLMGLVLGLAIYNRVLLDFPLPLPLYKKLLGQAVGLRDLEEMQPRLGRSLRQLLQYDGPASVEVRGGGGGVRQEWCCTGCCTGYAVACPGQWLSSATEPLRGTCNVAGVLTGDACCGVMCCRTRSASPSLLRWTSLVTCAPLG